MGINGFRADDLWINVSLFKFYPQVYADKKVKKNQPLLWLVDVHRSSATHVTQIDFLSWAFDVHRDDSCLPCHVGASKIENRRLAFVRE